MGKECLKNVWRLLKEGFVLGNAVESFLGRRTKVLESVGVIFIVSIVACLFFRIFIALELNFV